MTRYLLFMATLLCLLTSQPYADQSNAGDFLKKGILEQMSSYGDASITGIHGDKYYVNLERVCVCSAGMFLQTDYFGLVPLANLMQDDTGVYTLGLYDYYMCNDCGRCYRSCPASCDTCGGTDFTRIDNLED